MRRLFLREQLSHYCFNVCFAGEFPCFLRRRVSMENPGPGSRENPETRHGGQPVERNRSQRVDGALWDHYEAVPVSVCSVWISRPDTVLQLSIRWQSLSMFKSGFHIIRMYTLVFTDVAQK